MTFRALGWGFLLLLASLACGASNLAAAQDDEDSTPEMLPGMQAEYWAQPTPRGAPRVQRPEAQPALLLADGQTPDPRLPARGWQARWSGLLDIQQPGSYRLSVVSSGPFALRVDGRELLAGTLADEAAPAVSQPIELAIGQVPIEVRFTQQGEGARLRLAWEATDFAREAVPTRALGHAPNQPLADDGFADSLTHAQRHGCVNCHPSQTAAQSMLAPLKAPRLAHAGERLRRDWIEHWLADPRQVRPDATMPRLFSDGRQGDVERFVIAHWLAAQGEALIPLDEPPPTPDAQQAASGQRLFERTGCVACHGPRNGAPPRAALPAMAHKTLPDRLAEFLVDPIAWHPAGEMPSLGLSAEEAAAVAAYLCSPARNPADAPRPGGSAEPTADELSQLLAQLNPAGAKEATDRTAQLDMAALALLRERRCAACHEFAEPVARQIAPRSAADWAAITSHSDRGCLAATTTSAEVPRFADSLPRAELAKLLAEISTAPGTAAPALSAQLAIESQGCLACHERNGTGGLSHELLSLLDTGQSAQEAELLKPPTLTGVAFKLPRPALSAVLAEHARSRPWMALRMPRFAPPTVATLLAGLPALDGEAPALAGRVDESSELVEAGRLLVGAKGFGCIKCHDLRGIPSSGTRGPDLAKVAARVSPEWYRAWMTDPQRLEPGTRMPTVFFGGKTPLTELLGGDPARQREAIWHYLAQGEELELPEGLENASVAMGLATGPQVVRTFLPGLSPRGIALRFGNGVHLAFDAQNCRLAYAWEGDFLDMTPVWTGRGGQIAPVAGTTFWTAPAGFPWQVLERDAAPGDWAAQAADTALGAQPPDDGKLHPLRLRFAGYRLGGRGPTFRFACDSQRGATQFAERLESLAHAAPGVLRHSRVEAPPQSALWLAVAQLAEAPQYRRHGSAEWQAIPAEGIAADGAMVLGVDEGKPLFAHVRQSSLPAHWRVTKTADAWLLCLSWQTGASGEALDTTIAVRRPRATDPPSLAAAATAELAADPQHAE